MQQQTLSPIPVSSALAGTPVRQPKWGISRKLSNGEIIVAADPRATRAMVALMDMQAVLGGAASHWGGPSAFAELMSATHALMFHESQKHGHPWHELFHFVNDAGHCENGLYALKANYGFADLTLESLRGFRSIQSRLTGHGESHLFPEGVLLSNGPLGSAFPQSQGLCFADALAGRERITVTAISDGACMEGEAREAMAAIPGLASRGRMAPYVLIISDNNTKLNGRIDQEAYSMQPSFAALAAMGWKVLTLEKGHDLQACLDTIEAAFMAARAQPRQPVAIHARTVKGFGIQKTEASASGGHGFPLKEPKELKSFLQEIYKTEPIPNEFTKWAEELEAEAHRKSQKSKAAAVATEKVQVGVSAALIRKKNEGLPVVSISADLPGSTGVSEFQKKFPEATQDVGVAESNMISMAAGLSKCGYIPVVDTFSQFGVTKGALPLVMASLSQAPMIAVFSHAGFQDAADGASHQALTYFSKTCSIPHTDVYSLTCSSEADALIGQAIDEFYRARKNGHAPRGKVFFLGRENFPAKYAAGEANYELGRAQVVLDVTAGFPHAVTLVAAGALLGEALEAAEQLVQQRIGAVVVNPSIINHPDVDTVIECLRKSNGLMVTVEDHQVVGGMGSLLVHALAQEQFPYRVHSLGVCDEFGQSAYNAKDLYQKHGLDAASIIRAAQKLIMS